LKIADIRVQTFRYRSRTVADSEGHGHPGDEHDATATMMTVVSDEGAEGYAFGANRQVVEKVVKPALVGEDPFDREKLWQLMRKMQRVRADLSDRAMASVDLALWDLAGRYLDQPVHKLLGGYRDKVLAYASTMGGDEMPGGLSTPEEYARFAEVCMDRGYKAIKLHTWMPPIPWAPDPKMDVKACAAVREAVGPDVPLMLDPNHNYSREETLYLGREIEKLGFHWLEEPMDEYSVSSYVWLAEQLDIPIVGPETAKGGIRTRAEWVVRGASDILRGGVGDLGGLTPLMKLAHLAESFGMAMEVHGGGPGNIQALGAMGIPGEFYERGLLHPFIDFEEPDPWLNTRLDFMDDEGYVHIPQGPGLGQDINFDYIRDNAVSEE
jgi:L-alanine-DL-glutamate epimerase-like enolase superfamily enzyme